MTNKQRYTVEFKQEAVKLVTQQGYTQAKAARNLGVSDKNISRWIRELKGQSGPKLKISEEQAELKQLRKENQRLKQERDILKKAAAFFANESS